MQIGIDSGQRLWRGLLAAVLLGAWAVSPGIAQAAADTPGGGAAPKAATDEKTNGAAEKPGGVSATVVKKAAPKKASGKASAANKFDPFVGSASKKPWRGSQFIYSNLVSLISLNPGAELTYNPTYVMSFGFRPRWWFNDMFFVRAALDVTRELTQPDDTTYRNEAWLGDLALVAGAAKFWTIPKAKIDFSADLALTFPTSKASQAATLVMGIGPQLRLSRSFKVLKALIVGGNLRVTPYIHRYTTGELKSPLITNCSPNDGGCAAFLNSGGRNAAVRLATSLDVTLVILKWLSASLSYGWVVDWLRPASGGEGVISYEPQEPQNERYLSYFGATVSFSPLDALEIGVNWQTYSPQLAPNSTYRNPFYNRYTTLSLDLTLRVDGFIALFGGK